MSTMKENIYSLVIYNISSFSKIAWKAELFSWKEVEYELLVKHLENLTIEKFVAILNVLNKASAYL